MKFADSAAIPPPSSLSLTANNDQEPKSEDQGDKGMQT